VRRHRTPVAVLVGSSQLSELLAVAGRGVGDREAADEAVLGVDVQVLY
jgi:hypothetical protein